LSAAAPKFGPNITAAASLCAVLFAPRQTGPTWQLLKYRSRPQPAAKARSPMADAPDRPPPSEALSQLGRPVPQPGSPDEAVLEHVPNPHPGTLYLIRFAAPEFTSLCPITGQPDFAHLVIDYVPDARIVESKSLKLYLASFRNHGAFHEGCTIDIGKRLVAELTPQWLRIGGYWYPRGGIPIDVFWQTGAPPQGLWLPDQGVAPYRGRG
jgi:7-cyano-7-deazaguanine reductase